MINIQLTEKMRLVSDRHQYKLQKLTITKEGEKWYGIKFYPTIALALKNIPEQLLRESDITQISEIRDKLEEYQNMIMRELG